MINAKYSIVIPVYKSTSSLIELANRIDKLFISMPGNVYELIFVNDSPFDSKTVKTLESLARKSPNVIVIELMKNFGQQAAILCGIDFATGDYIVTMDDDLQHYPEDIPKLIKKNNHDVVIGKFKSKKHSFFKRNASEIKGYFDYIILGKPRWLKLSPFRMIKTEVAKLMVKRNTPHPFISALLFEITDDLVNVDIDHYPRLEGNSSYTFSKMVQLFGNLIINNSSLLLRLVGYLGVTIALAASVAAFALLIRKLFFGYLLEGWASIIVLILFFGGLTLLTLGIIGEYLIRIIATAEERPTFHVRKIYNGKKL